MNIYKYITNTILASSLIFAGCQTQQATPIPNTTSVVLVGLGYQCDKKELQKKGADSDLQSVYECIRYCYGGQVHYIWDAGYKGVQPKSYMEGPFCDMNVYQDANAKVESVKAAMRLAIKSDLAIIYFSCKATQLQATDPEEADGLDEALRLYDGLLVDNDIWTILKEAKGRVFIIFDTSYAASMFKASASENDGLAIDLAEEATSLNDVEGPNMVCWSACLEGESIDERSIGSRMTNALYFKYYNKENTYDQVYDRVYNSTIKKQNTNKTVLGTDFSNLSIFR